MEARIAIEEFYTKGERGYVTIGEYSCGVFSNFDIQSFVERFVYKGRYLVLRKREVEFLYHMFVLKKITAWRFLETNNSFFNFCFILSIEKDHLKVASFNVYQGFVSKQFTPLGYYDLFGANMVDFRRVILREP